MGNTRYNACNNNTPLALSAIQELRNMAGTECHRPENKKRLDLLLVPPLMLDSILVMELEIHYQIECASPFLEIAVK